MKRLLSIIVVLMTASFCALAQGTELWNPSVVTIEHTWFANTGWGQETASTATYDAGTLTVNIAVDKAAQWQGQVFLNSAVTYNPAKMYDFSFKISATKNLGGVTYKVDDNTGMVNANAAISVNAGETFTYSIKNIPGQVGNGKMVFDFGYASAGTTITITEISVIEHDPVVVGLDPTKSCDATSGNATLAIDGNLGTRWESAFSDDQMWQVNYGEPKEFNTVQIVWEGAYASSFKLQGSANGTDWTDLKVITDQTLTGFPNTQNIDLGTTVIYQYLRFVGVKRALPYGYSFWELSSFVKVEPVLTTYDVTPAQPIAKVGTGVVLNVRALDQYGAAMADETTFSVNPIDAATISGNSITPTKPGLITVTATATAGPATATCEIFAYAGDNLALSTAIDTDNKIIAQSDFAPNGTDAFHAVDTDEGSVYQGSATNGTAGDEAARTYNSWFVIDLGKTANIELVTVKFEGACSQNYHIDFASAYDGANTTWTTAYNYVGTEGVNGRTDVMYPEGPMNLTNTNNVRYVRFYSTKAATQWGMKIFDMKVYGVEVAQPSVDVTVDPVVGYASLYYDKELTTTDDVKIYTGTVNGNSLVLTDIGTKTIPANTAVLVNGTSHFTVSNTGATFTGTNVLKGVLVDTDVTSLSVMGILALGSVEGVPGFYKYTGTTAAANKAYIKIEDILSAKSLTLVVEGDETNGISNVNADTKEGTVYNLNGVRVNKSALNKGVYIVNGDKHVVK